MWIASPFARILGGAIMIGLALYFFGEGRIAWREGVNFHLDLAPGTAWVVILALGIFGAMTMIDGLFRMTNGR